MSFIEDNVPWLISFVISIVLFIFFITCVSKSPRGSKRNTKWLKGLFIVTFVLGMIVYCFCHYRVLEAVAKGTLEDRDHTLEWVKDENTSRLYYIPYVVVRSVLDVATMFYGRANSSVFYNWPESKDLRLVFGFWLLHMLAFFTASAVLLVRFGENLLIWIKGKLAQWRNLDVYLIFGINDSSLALGRKMADIKGSMFVYVDDVINEDYESSIHDLGGAIYSDTNALKVTLSFLNDISIKKNKLNLYTLSKEYDKNLQYARMMLESLKELNIHSEQTRLVILGIGEEKGMLFQSSDNQYGYGSVLSFDECEMSARLLIHEYPLCNTIDFDKSGRATENMEVLIVGFGCIGQEVLRKIVANGQFEGSSFHATIYDPKFINRIGFFKSQYPMIFVKYNIDFEPEDGRSEKFFSFLKENASRLKYIVICLADNETARDIAICTVDSLHSMGYSRNVYTCDSKSVKCYSWSVQECKSHEIYDSELLYSGELDRYAMELNHRYCIGNERIKSPEETWKECKYFHRMSSRASVDYLIPLIRRISTIMDTNSLTHEQMENLARSEHLRWCAFYYTFGYDVMEKDEFLQRIKEQIKKPTQDTEKMKHVCLVSWDELDEISRIENSLTHGNRDYKQNDKDNVDMIIELIKLESTM